MAKNSLWVVTQVTNAGAQTALYMSRRGRLHFILLAYFVISFFISLEESVSREKLGHNLGLKTAPKSRGAGNS